MLSIDDHDLPGLSEISEGTLREITGADHVTMLRLRYRESERAILHIAADTDGARTEGALWFFRGDKAKRIARRNKTTARYAPQVQALFESFPNDHRMPQIRDFLARCGSILPGLAGAAPTAAPELLRYRPGLSCTFRCALVNGAVCFVKVINDDDPSRILAANRSMQQHFSTGPVTVAPALGTDLSVSAIAYAAAPGRPLDAVLQQGEWLAPLEQTIAGLRGFWQAPLAPERDMGPEKLLLRAQESAAFVRVTAPSCNAAVGAVVARLEATMPQVGLRPIHGDMKLEHVFLDGDRAVLIDTESVSFGPADYDLAQLYGRLWQAELEQQLPRTLVVAACERVRAEAGPAFDWCRDVVALRLAKFYAQRPSADMEQKISAILGRLV